MKRTAIAALFAGSVFNAAAHAQPRITYQISRVYLPSNNMSVLMFLDYAQISVTATVSPPIGTQITYAPPPGPGTGTIAGLGSITFDIVECDRISGTWTLSGTGFQGTTGNTWGVRNGWDIFGMPGTPQSNGDILDCNAAQFVVPGATANSTNPVAEIWRAKWNPGSFPSGGQMRLTLVPRSATVLVQYGTSPTGPLYTSVPAIADPAWVNIFFDTGPPPPCFPSITQTPQSTVAYSGGPVVFRTHGMTFGSGCGPLTYRWRHDCQLLSDGPRISGAMTDTLRIDPVMPGDIGQYDALVGGLRTDAAWLAVVCYPNCDGSTTDPVLNINDFICFQAQFAAGGSYANCDSSTTPPVLNVNDFICFQQRFAAGCQ